MIPAPRSVPWAEPCREGQDEQPHRSIEEVARPGAAHTGTDPTREGLPSQGQSGLPSSAKVAGRISFPQWKGTAAHPTVRG